MRHPVSTPKGLWELLAPATKASSRRAAARVPTGHRWASPPGEALA